MQYAERHIHNPFHRIDPKSRLDRDRHAMTFDPMAAAVDWLDAYRDGDIGAILSMYADDAVTECACDGLNVAGKEGLRAYWERRLRDYPAAGLDDLQPYVGGATISYIARDCVVAATMEFNNEGRISRLRSGPSK